MSLFGGCSVRFQLSRKLLRLRECESPPDSFQHQSRPPERDRCHPMRQHRKERRRLVSVVGPALARGAPQLKIISKTCACKKCEQRAAMIGRRKHEQDAQPKRKPG